MKLNKMENFTIENLVEEPQFRTLLLTEIKRIISIRSASHPTGMKYKRGVYDFLQENGLLAIDAFSKEFLLIHYKKSALPANVRSYIHSVCLSAAIKALHLKKKENNPEELLTQ